MPKIVKDAECRFSYKPGKDSIVTGVTLVFDKALPSLNQFVGKRWGKLNWQNKFLCRMKNVQPIVQKPTKVKMRVYRYGLKLLDRADNLPGGLKPLLDALKIKKVIWDDDPKHLELLVFDSEVKKRSECRTVVEIDY
jgi:hypothetical protein